MPDSATSASISPLYPGPLVLVVNDDQGERLTLTRMVRGLGYPTRSCRGGRDALRFLQSHRRRARVLVADLGMPGMDGGELVERALDLDRSLQVVLTADLEDPGTAELLPGYRDLPVLIKPIRFADLYGTLVALVGTPPGGVPAPASVRTAGPRTRRRPSGHHVV